MDSDVTEAVALDAAWDRLHGEGRFRPRYPSESVIRFLARNASTSADRVLDLGCGAGRHLSLCADLGIKPIGFDYSLEGLSHARSFLADRGIPTLLAQGRMEELPFAGQAFDVVVAYGVVNYTTPAGMSRTIDEIHRILRPDGSLLIVTRTTSDHRYGQGREVGRHSFVLDTDETNEQGMVQTFLDEQDIAETFAAFVQVTIDRNTFTAGGGSIVNDDWIIEARK